MTKFRDKLRKGQRRGVSEVIGAFLLMIVVVVAVGAFALYLSEAQKDAEVRQTFQNAVKNKDTANY